MEVEFKIDPGSGHIHVPVRVNGQGPLVFALDTGASITTISKSLANRLGIETYEGEKKRASGAGGNQIPVEEAELDSFTIGTETFGDLKVGVVNFEAKFGGAGCFTDGVIGYTMLKDYVLSVNYNERLLRLWKPNGGESTRARLEWTPFKYLQDSHLVGVPTYINGNGPFDLVLDTGSGGNIITPTMAAEIGLIEAGSADVATASPCSDGECVGVGGRVTGFATKVKEFSVGGKSQSDFMLGVIDLKVISPTGKKMDLGIVGYPFLKDFELFLDYPNQRFALVDLRSV
jgi:predicted aspartyl protease